MKMENFTYASEVDALPIHALLVAPEGEVKGTLLMAHGIAEYKERYLPMMRFLAENGFACAMNDHRGYGQSVKSGEDLGYTYEKGADGTIRDLNTLASLLNDRYPDKKRFLYGHSMGSLCAVNYLKRYASGFSGMILSGLPANNSAAALGKKYLKVKKMMKGGRYRDESVNKLMFSNYAAKFKGESSPYAWINSDPACVKAYEDDPLCGFLGTVDGYLSLIDLLIGAYERKDWKVTNNLMPIFIAVGASDPCAEGEKGAREGEAYFKAVGYVRTESKVYPAMRHEIHNEPNGMAVMNDMLGKLNAWL